MSTIVGCGAMIQAMVAKTLILRTTKDIYRLDNASDIWRFLILGGPIASLTSAAIGSTSLLLFGAIRPSDYTFTAFTWWTGDTIGAIIFTPLVLAFLQSQTPLW